ncbi:hypothetical protein KEM48_005031 [Puccinia striiformis f. sp. tritici PST-130]|nr:hypothetical protein KEM48_005031 [Puccinia striiformis f. sp. tritici PST-130]
MMPRSLFSIERMRITSTPTRSLPSRVLTADSAAPPAGLTPPATPLPILRLTPKLILRRIPRLIPRLIPRPIPRPTPSPRRTTLYRPHKGVDAKGGACTCPAPTPSTPPADSVKSPEEQPAKPPADGTATS